MTESNLDLPATIRYQRNGPLGCITLNRPDKLNAINATMIRGLHHALDLAEADEAVRVILLAGEGRAFSAGFDLHSGSGDIDFWRAELGRGLEIIMRFWDSPKPTIAAVHGYCLGSAMEMALACDITLAAEGCRFGAPEVKYGSGIVCLILPWLVGPKLAKEMLLSGDDRIDSARALACGMVNQVFAPEQLAEAGIALARTIAANDARAVRLTKRAINRGIDIMGLRAALAEALEIDAELESGETPESVQFNTILRDEGLKAALAWRRSRTENEA